MLSRKDLPENFSGLQKRLARPLTFDFNALIDGLNVTHKVRVVSIDGKPWFVAGDVRRVLGIAQAGSNFAFLAEDERRQMPRGISSGKGMTQALLLSESGLYKFVMRSTKPVAKPFQDWVTREVLPAFARPAATCWPARTARRSARDDGVHAALPLGLT
ncbi:BRO-N domain-containing protein [Blastochloris tepida]|nr:BRO family protein [Blastochloris tepida]